MESFEMGREPISADKTSSAKLVVLTLPLAGYVSCPLAYVSPWPRETTG